MKFSEKFAKFIVKARWYFFALFLALAVGSLFLIPMVGVNYDMTKYLPEDSNTKVAIEVMSDQFGASGTASVMVSNASVTNLNSLKTEIENVSGVASVVFDTSSADYYDGTNALFKVFFEESDYTENVSNALLKIREICSEYEVAISGSAAEASSSRNAIGTEIPIILAIAVAIVFIILLLTSKSWLEPLVYLFVIGVAILINMGTNVLLGEVSFITKSISTIMLIALEMDYCIVLCSRYREELSKFENPTIAMEKALSGSLLSVVASSLTVMAGLVALMFMDFSIGFDIGAVLAKGVLISVIAVIFFMPSVILMFSKAMQKTAHRSFLPKMDKLGSFAYKTRKVIPVVFLCIVVLSSVLQTGMSYEYVAKAGNTGSQIQIEIEKIENAFGKQNSLVVMVEKGDFEKEKVLFNDICNIEVEGEKYINTKSAIVATGLYEKVSIDTLVSNYGIDQVNAVEIFAEMGKAETDTVYLADLINYFHTNNTKISSIANEKQQNIDNLYNAFNSSVFNNLYTNLTPASAQAIYNLSDVNMMKQIFASILHYDVADVLDSDLVPNWAIMEVLYSGDIDGWASTLTPIFESEYHPFLKLTKQQIIATYNLNSDVVDSIFQKNMATENLRVLQLVNTLHARIDDSTIILNIAKQTQATIEGGYVSMQTANAMFLSQDYSRMIFNINLAVDDQNAIKFIEKLNVLMENSGYQNYYIANSTSNLIETSEVFKTDKTKTDLITFFAILLIVLLSFRSISIPILLVLAIQGAIWINLAINTIAGSGIYFICYLLAVAIQMGATIDYGILLTDRYKQFRKTMDKKQAMQNALNASITTILTSGLILIIAPFLIHFISSTPIIAEIGLMIGRGALVSVITVLFVLPQILMLFDKVIEKTSYKFKFYVPATNAALTAEKIDENPNSKNSDDFNNSKTENIKQNNNELKTEKSKLNNNKNSNKNNEKLNKKDKTKFDKK